MNKRVCVVGIMLLLSLLLTLAGGAEHRLGGFSCPPVQRGGLYRGLHTVPGLLFELYAEDYEVNTGGVATWADRSSNGNSFSQSVETLKPLIEYYDGVKTLRSGPTLKILNRGPFNGGSLLSACFVYANRTVLPGSSKIFALWDHWANWQRFQMNSYDVLNLEHGLGLTCHLTATGAFMLDAPLRTGMVTIPSVNGRNPTFVVDNTLVAEFSGDFTGRNGNTSTHHLFADSDGYYGDMNIFAFVAWNRSLSPAEARFVTSCMMRKLEDAKRGIKP